MGGQDQDRLLTVFEVASLFRVDPKTIRRWTTAGKLTPVPYPGRNLRYRESEVRALINDSEAGSSSP